MLADAAIAVNPNDSRYKVPSQFFFFVLVMLTYRQHLHNKFVIHPFIDRRLPIITDDSVLDTVDGTGAVKIAPAHDQYDYEIGLRHNLPLVNILNDNGTLNDNAGEFKVRYTPQAPSEADDW